MENVDVCVYCFGERIELATWVARLRPGFESSWE